MPIHLNIHYCFLPHSLSLAFCTVMLFGPRRAVHCKWQHFLWQLLLHHQLCLNLLISIFTPLEFSSWSYVHSFSSCNRLSGVVVLVNLQNWVWTQTTPHFRFKVWQMAILSKPAPELEVQREGSDFFISSICKIQLKSYYFTFWTSGALQLGSHLNLSRASKSRFGKRFGKRSNQTYTALECRQSIM